MNVQSNLTVFKLERECWLYFEIAEYSRYKGMNLAENYYKRTRFMLWVIRGNYLSEFMLHKSQTTFTLYTFASSMSRQKCNSMIGKYYDLISQLREREDVDHAYITFLEWKNMFYWANYTCSTS